MEDPPFHDTPDIDGYEDEDDDDATTVAPDTERLMESGNQYIPPTLETTEPSQPEPPIIMEPTVEPAVPIVPEKEPFPWAEARSQFIRGLGSTPVFEALKETFGAILNESDEFNETPFPAAIMKMRANESVYKRSQLDCGNFSGAHSSRTAENTCNSSANELVSEDPRTNVIFVRGSEGACTGWRHMMKYVDAAIIRAIRRRFDEMRGPWSSALTQKSQYASQEYDIRIISGLSGVHLASPKLIRTPSTVTIEAHYIITGPSKEGAASIFADFVTNDVLRCYEAMTKSHCIVGLDISLPHCNRKWRPHQIRENAKRCCVEIQEACIAGGSVVLNSVIDVSSERLMEKGSVWGEKVYAFTFKLSKGGKSQKEKKEEYNREPTRLMPQSPADLLLKGILYEGVDAVQCCEAVDERAIKGGVMCPYGDIMVENHRKSANSAWKNGDMYRLYECLLELTLLESERGVVGAESRLSDLHYFLAHSPTTVLHDCEIACKCTVAAFDGLSAGQKEGGCLVVARHSFNQLRFCLVEAKILAKSYLSPAMTRISALMTLCLPSDPSIVWENLDTHIDVSVTPQAHSALKKLLAIFHCLVIESGDSMHRVSETVVGVVNNIGGCDSGSMPHSEGSMILRMNDAIKDIINRRVAPPSFAANAVKLQYAVDTGIDVALSDISFEITANQNGEDESTQFSIAMRILLKQSVRLGSWSHGDSEVMRNIFRRPVLTNARTNVYQMTGKRGSISGYRGTVAIAEPDAVLYLREQTSVFFKSSAVLSALPSPYDAYDAASATAIVGDTLLVGAVSKFVPRLDIQCDVFMQGPSIDGAKSAFGQIVVNDSTEIMGNDDGHVVIGLEVVLPPISSTYSSRVVIYGPTQLDSAADGNDDNTVVTTIARAIKNESETAKITLKAYASIDGRAYMSIHKQYYLHFVDSQQPAARQLVFSSPVNPSTMFNGVWCVLEEAELVMNRLLRGAAIPEVCSDIDSFVQLLQWNADELAYNGKHLDARRKLLSSSIVPEGPNPSTIAECVRVVMSEAELLNYLEVYSTTISSIVIQCIGHDPSEPSVDEINRSDIRIWSDVFDEEILWKMVGTLVEKLVKYLTKPALAISGPLTNHINSIISDIRDISDTKWMSLIPSMDGDQPGSAVTTSRRKKGQMGQPKCLAGAQVGACRLVSALTDLSSVLSAVSAMLEQSLEWACKTNISLEEEED